MGGAGSSPWRWGSQGAGGCWVPGRVTAVAGAALGLFSSLFAQPWGQPAMRIKAGVPRGSQLLTSLEGRERGSCPRAFPTMEGATMPALPGLTQCQAQPTRAQGWVTLVGTPLLPGCPLVGAAAPCVPPLQELGDPGAGRHGSLGPERRHVLLCFS